MSFGATKHHIIVMIAIKLTEAVFGQTVIWVFSLAWILSKTVEGAGLIAVLLPTTGGHLNYFGCSLGPSLCALNAVTCWFSLSFMTAEEELLNFGLLELRSGFDIFFRVKQLKRNQTKVKRKQLLQYHPCVWPTEPSFLHFNMFLDHTFHCSGACDMFLLSLVHFGPLGLPYIPDRLQSDH